MWGRASALLTAASSGVVPGSFNGTAPFEAGIEVRIRREANFLRRVLLNLITWGAAKNALRLALPRA
jgi:hypothetical protein